RRVAPPPFREHPPARVLDEHRVEVTRRDRGHLLLDEPRAEGIGAADLDHAALSAEHLRHELVAREDEEQPARGLAPPLVAHDAEPGEPPPQGHVPLELVLRLAGPRAAGGLRAGVHVTPRSKRTRSRRCTRRGRTASATTRAGGTSRT